MPRKAIPTKKKPAAQATHKSIWQRHHHFLTKLALGLSLSLNVIVVGGGLYAYHDLTHAASSKHYDNILSMLFRFEQDNYCSQSGYSTLMRQVTRDAGKTDTTPDILNHTRQSLSVSLCGVDYQTGRYIDFTSLKPDNSTPAALPAQAQ